MKKINCLPLLGAFLFSGVAMADPAYTLSTSANMVDNYSVWDSGLQHVQGGNFLSQTSVNNTSAKVLSTFQDAVSLQWYAQTEFTTSTTYTNLYQAYEQDVRSLQVNTNSNDPSQADNQNNWFDLSLSADAGLTQYSVWASGWAGSRTSPRGIKQLITPAMGVMIDGDTRSADWSLYNDGINTLAYTSMVGSLPGSAAASSFQMVAEATDGGMIYSFSVQLQSSRVLGAQYTQDFSQITGQWTENVAISAPVPEPQTYALLLAGLIFVGGALRRRSQG